MRVDADLTLFVDGRRATVRGSGMNLRLTLEQPHMLRKFFAIALPHFGQSGKTDYSLIPRLLAREGLTLEIADSRGLLMLLGAEAAGKSYTLPGLGKLEHVKLAGPGALLRLALNL